MGEFLSNPEIERLVQEMNRLVESKADHVLPDEDPVAGDLDAHGLRHVVAGDALELLLTEMARRKASDLILVPDSPPVLRINGKLHRLDEPAVDGEHVLTGDPGKIVEMPVEAEDVFDVMDPHDSEVNGIPSGQLRVADDDLACLLNDVEIDRQHLIDDLEHDLEARLDGVASVDGHIAVEDLLQDLGVGDEYNQRPR